MAELIEIAPGRFRVKRSPQNFARSDLPLPNIISDIMDPVEQVDGRFYTSKRQYRAVGRAHGLIEIGNEKIKPKQRNSETPQQKQARRASLHRAIERYRSR